MTEMTTAQDKTIQIEDELKTSYMSYAMSVIVSRALPDVRDGLKPVHRRIVYSMHENGYTAGKAFKKSARIVGDVIGKYHPHGDQSIYDAMVRMAQPFAMRHPLVDGQGNFGSIDNDPPAAMRYTEARMTKLTQELTTDIDEETVQFDDNYDGSCTEPRVLPARFPNILVNGATGIAVGMATNMAPHNLGEVIDATIAYVENPNIDLGGILKIMPGPDFPTYGVIMGVNGIRQAYETGRGQIVLSGVAEIIDNGRKSQIVISELPYGVVKADFIEKLATAVNDEKIDGITDIRDESDRKASIRVVIDIRRGADPSVVLNHIKSQTDFVSTFNVNSVCLDSRGRPATMGVLRILQEFTAFRRETIRRRTVYRLNKARDALHKQIGLFAAVSLIDHVVQTIRSSQDVDEARSRLMAIDFPTEGEFAELLSDAEPDDPVEAMFRLSDIQANAILALNLRSLTGLERDKIAVRARELAAEIRALSLIVSSRKEIDRVMVEELSELRARFAEDRRTRIEASEFEKLSDEALVERKDIVVTMSQAGYIKRTDVHEYRAQRRGGKGRAGMDMRDGDFVVRSFVTHTHAPLVFFTTRGSAYLIKAYQLPEAAPNARGRSLAQYMQLADGEEITSVVAMPETEEEIDGKALVFVTDFGKVRRSDPRSFLKIQRSGKRAMDLEGPDGKPVGRVVDVLLANEDDDLLLVSSEGMAIRFHIAGLNVIGSTASHGVAGMKLPEEESIVRAATLPHLKANRPEIEAYLAGGVYTYKDADGIEQTVKLTSERKAEIGSADCMLFVCFETGFAKLVSAHAVRTTSRGGQGVEIGRRKPTTGAVAAVIKTTSPDDTVILSTNLGTTIRIHTGAIPVKSRSARGVKAQDLSNGEHIVSAALVVREAGETDNDEAEPGA